MGNNSGREGGGDLMVKIILMEKNIYCVLQKAFHDSFISFILS